MIKIIFYQLFESKEVKYLQSNKGGCGENPPGELRPVPRQKNIPQTRQYKYGKITKKIVKNTTFFHIVIQTMPTQLFF